MNDAVAKNYSKVKEMIAEACVKAGRDTNDVTVVGVTKYTDVQGVQACIDAGILNIGENLAQHALPKIEALGDAHQDVHWHFIGHLQTNKVKYLVPFVALIHGIDSVKLIQEVNKQAAKINRRVNCLLQVHIADEENKFGFTPSEIMEIFSSGILSTMENVRIIGLMGMATFTDNRLQIRNEFKKLKHVFDTIKLKYSHDYPEFKELSMGMSDDFQIAIEEGSTMVRVGSSIFGKRQY